MPEYLSKEEIRKWRSSLERITLEEYAARLGKVIQEEKHDDSLVDSVIFRSLNSMSVEKYEPKTEKIQTLAIKSFNKEKEIKKETKEIISQKPVVKEETSKKTENKEPKKKEQVKAKEVKIMPTVNEDINISFKKALTAREQIVFDYFFANKNNIVYAKDLAAICI